MTKRFLLQCAWLAGAVAAAPMILQAQAACPDIDTTATWVRVRKAWSDGPGATWTHDSLRRVLLDLEQQDQAVRTDFGARAGDSSYLRALARGDSARSRILAGIIDRFGLPTRAMVGSRGADAMMLLILHSPTLQERAVAMADSLPAGSLPGHSLAMLDDDLRTRAGQPQRFGSEFRRGADGLFRLAPVDDPAGLESRRAKAGLPPIAFDICNLEQMGMKIDRSSLPPP